MGLNKMLKMHDNREQCISIMSDAFKIWNWGLKPLLHRQDGIPSDFIQESIPLIIQAYLYCENLSNSNKLKRFTFAHGHENELQTWKKKLDLFWSKANTVMTVDIREKLSAPPPLASIIPGSRIVGLEERQRDVMQMLNLDDKEATIVVVLHGMGGVGKSTLADAVYNQVSLSGDQRCRCQIELGEKPSSEHITNLQKQMVENLTGQSLWKETDSKSIKGKLRNVLKDKNRDPAFIYIDNVLRQKDLEDFLSLDSELFALPSGSRWLVTARDESVCTKVFGRNEGLQIIQFRVSIMNEIDARKLFLWHAFGQEEPSKELVVEDYHDNQDLVTKMVTSICGHLPLALRVLGRSLFGKNPPEWRKMYDNIRTNGMPGSLEEQVSNVLKSSYNTLDEETQTAFLLICVCFVGESYRTALDVVESILPRASTYRLLELGLLEIEITNYQAVKMHDLVRNLGYKMAVARKCAPARMLAYKQNLDCDESSWSTIKWLQVPPWEDGIEAEFLERCREVEVLLLGTHVKGHIEHIPQHLKVIIAKSRPCPLDLVEKLKKLVYLEVAKPVHLEVAEMEIQEFPVVASSRSLQVLRGVSIPEEAVDLHKNTLRKFDCQNIEELSPYFCQQMSKLQTLVITDFKGGTLPEEMGDLASLECLWIESVCLAKLPHSLAKLTQLQGLFLDLKYVAEIPSGVLCCLKRLELMGLTVGIRVTCVPMQDISQLASLEALVLRIPFVERLTTHELARGCCK